MKNPLAIFVLLQVLDTATTLIALALGGRESNPLVAHFMTIGPVGGLLLTKLLITSIAAGGALLHKYRGLRVANFAFTGIVAWNVSIIARLAM